jgi:hypothetical protein
MLTLEEWLAQRGAGLATALDNHRELICGTVSTRLATSFPTLCYDASRADAQAFQQHTYHETPRRFHRLLQVMLHFQAIEVIEREYRWGWPVLQRYGVERYHLLAQVRFYFEAARAHLRIGEADRTQLEELEAMILQIISQVAHTPAAAQSNGHLHSNGVHPHD